MKSTGIQKTTTSSSISDSGCEFLSVTEWLEGIEYEKLMFDRRLFLESYMEPEEVSRQMVLYEPIMRQRARVNVSFDLRSLNTENQKQQDWESAGGMNKLDKHFSGLFSIIRIFGLVGMSVAIISIAYSAASFFFNS